MLKGAPRVDRVSCVWSASSRVGATTRTDTEFADFDFDFDFLGFSGTEMTRARAGMPNANVLPLNGNPSVSGGGRRNVATSALAHIALAGRTFLFRRYLLHRVLGGLGARCKLGLELVL